VIRTLIADDEALAADLLKAALEATGRAAVLGIARDGAECLRLLESLRPDALFLDIRMPNMTGIEVAEAANEAGLLPLLVFVTDHDEYAVKAFELAAIDFIVKPVDLSELELRVAATVERLERNLTQPAQSLAALQESLKLLTGQREQQAPLRRLPVKDYDEGTVRLVPPSEVSHVERIGDVTVLHTESKAFRTYHSIGRLEERLQSAGFVRANRGSLINTSFIKHLIPNGDGSYDALLDTPERVVVTVSRSRAKNLLDNLDVA